MRFRSRIDRITLGTDEEGEYEVTDRKYWENRSTKKIMGVVDKIFTDLENYTSGYELKYNKFYVDLAKDVIVKKLHIF